MPRHAGPGGAPVPAPVRVVFVEDDSAMHLYMQTAVEELPIDLVCCRTIAEAWQALHEGPTGLLIVDLMLGGESGLTLITRLRSGPPALRSIRVAVTSAATDTPGMRDRLLALGIWRVMQKPVAIARIEACVREALHDGTAATPPVAPAVAGPPAAAEAGLGPDQAAALAELFGHDRSLYLRYREACLAQFPADVSQGDDSLARGDSESVRRLAHNLRSVLRALGEPAAAGEADRLEAATMARDMEAARSAWAPLRARLRALREGGSA